MVRAALPPGEFVAELKGIVRDHPFDPRLAQDMKYGRAKIEHVRRFAKDYYRYIENDVQGAAATLARCLDRRLFLELSRSLSRKAGFFQIANPVELYLRFTDSLGVSREELARHYACAETLGGLFTKRNFQHSSFLEGFVSFHLCSEGSMMEASADSSAFLGQKGFAEYMRRNYGLADGATDYWRAYEDFHSLDGERAWEIVAELATDASSQQTMRRTLFHSVSVYQSMRKAWSDIASGSYWDPEIRWPSR